MKTDWNNNSVGTLCVGGRVAPHTLDMQQTFAQPTPTGGYSKVTVYFSLCPLGNITNPDRLTQHSVVLRQGNGVLVTLHIPLQCISVCSTFKLFHKLETQSHFQKPDS
ncbi:hypothetical protein GOODEAATRI_027431 [Goodea atripinnis]|uniref:Uncharacterized protein n=1 Tax=Goodea atripinnis TaxID=208336 RepID=A0ABV0NE43_9TELE